MTNGTTISWWRCLLCVAVGPSAQSQYRSHISLVVWRELGQLTDKKLEKDSLFKRKAVVTLQ